MCPIPLLGHSCETGQMTSGASFLPDLLVQGLKKGWMAAEKVSV